MAKDNNNQHYGTLGLYLEDNGYKWSSEKATNICVKVKVLRPLAADNNLESYLILGISGVAANDFDAWQIKLPGALRRWTSLTFLGSSCIPRNKLCSVWIDFLRLLAEVVAQGGRFQCRGALSRSEIIIKTNRDFHTVWRNKHRSRKRRFLNDNVNKRYGTFTLRAFSATANGNF